MNAQDVIALNNAGWTKAEILALTGADSTPGNPTPTPKPEEIVPAKVNDTDKKEEPAPQPTNQISLTEEQLKLLIQGVAVQTASGTIETPKDLTQTLNYRLASIMKGE